MNNIDKRNRVRRNTLKTLALGAGTLAAPALMLKTAHAQSRAVKIGFVSPQTGQIAAFGEADKFVLDGVRAALGKGISIAGKQFPVEIIYKDSQSNPNRAAEVTNQLINNDKCDIILGTSTSDTVNPVASQCELAGVPCVTSDNPWQAYFFGRKGDPKKGFEWTYHFFWGLEDVIGVFTNLWSQFPTSKTVGSLFPNDSDGNAWGDAKLGFPPVLAQKGFKLVDKGRFQSPADDFSAYIAEFKKNNVEIVTGVLPPPDFANFWTQAGQQGFKPKIVTAAKATEFPAAIQSFGSRAEGLSVEVWWSPAHPFSSSLNDMSSAALAAAYTRATSRPWAMPLAFKHSLFEVALDALKRAADLKPESIRNAIRDTNLNTIVGPINFRKGPVPNIAKTPLVGGQWKKAGKGFELVVVENSQAPMVPVKAKFDPLG